MQSPPKPWNQGVHPSYTAFQIVVNICQDEHGNVWSDHQYLTPEDESIGSNLKDGGVTQIAHALMTEAVRREVFVCVLIGLTQEPDLLGRWSDGTPEDRQIIEERFVRAAREVLTATAVKMLPKTVPGILDMMSKTQGERVVGEGQ